MCLWGGGQGTGAQLFGQITLGSSNKMVCQKAVNSIKYTDKR